MHWWKDREVFENIHAKSPNPWGFETSRSWYVGPTYKRRIEVLAHRRYPRALEVGCSIGLFTAMLAPLCEELLAVDISENAVALAKERLVDFPHVRVERRTLPEEMPEGPFDLIVAGEVLYYWPGDLLLAALRRFEEILAPDGALLAQHNRINDFSWRRRSIEKISPLFLRRWLLRNRPTIKGDVVHELLLKHTRLANTVSLVEPNYRLDLFEKK